MRCNFISHSLWLPNVKSSPVGVVWDQRELVWPLFAASVTVQSETTSAAEPLMSTPAFVVQYSVTEACNNPKFIKLSIKVTIWQVPHFVKTWLVDDVWLLKKVWRVKEIKYCIINYFDVITGARSDTVSVNVLHKSIVVLCWFSLSGRRLRRIDRSVLQQMTSLTTLNLSDNELRIFPSSVCLTALRHLDVSENCLNSLEFVENMPQLEDLRVEGNGLKVGSHYHASAYWRAILI